MVQGERGSTPRAAGRSPTPNPHPLTPDAVAGLVIVALGGWVLWQAAQLRAGPGYAAVGPRVFPVIVGLGLLGSGAAVLGGALRAARAAARAGAGAVVASGVGGERPVEEPTDWTALLAMAACLAAYVALFRPLGFVLASIGFFVAGAWALGSRAWVRDLVAGALVSVITFGVFTWLLGLELPAGPLEPLVRALHGLFVPPPTLGSCQLSVAGCQVSVDG